MTRGRAARKLVGLITRRSQVQILSPLLCLDSSVGRAEDWKSSCHWFDSGSGHCLRKKASCITDGALAQVVEHLTFNQVVRGSNPRCLIRKRKPSLVRVVVFFFYWYIVNWIPDNVVDRGARRPGDVCSARTEAERRLNPRCLIINEHCFFDVQKINYS